MDDLVSLKNHKSSSLVQYLGMLIFKSPSLSLKHSQKGRGPYLYTTIDPHCLGCRISPSNIAPPPQKAERIYSGIFGVYMGIYI